MPIRYFITLLLTSSLSLSAFAATLSQTTYDYTPLNQPSQLHNPESVFTYRYNKDSDVAQKTAVNAGQSLTTTYTYDDLNRVTAHQASGQVAQTQTFDLNSNVRKLSGPGGVASLSYNSLNQLLAITSAGFNETFTYQNNNLVNNSLGEQFTYNPQNQLLSYTPVSGPEHTFTYAPSGQRLTQTLKGKTEVYYYQGLTLLNTNTTSYLYGSQRIAALGNTTPMLFTYDARGDVVGTQSLTSNTPMSRYHYGILGLTQNDTPNSNNPFYYAGYLTDHTQNIHNTTQHLQYLNARYLQSTQLPNIGSVATFLTQDTSNGSGALPAYNHYLYANDNSVNGNDPTGHSFQSFMNQRVSNNVAIGVGAGALGAVGLAAGSSMALTLITTNITIKKPPTSTKKEFGQIKRANIESIKKEYKSNKITLEQAASRLPDLDIIEQAASRFPKLSTLKLTTAKNNFLNSKDFQYYKMSARRTIDRLNTLVYESQELKLLAQQIAKTMTGILSHSTSWQDFFNNIANHNHMPPSIKIERQKIEPKSDISESENTTLLDSDTIT